MRIKKIPGQDWGGMGGRDLAGAGSSSVAVTDAAYLKKGFKTVQSVKNADQ